MLLRVPPWDSATGARPLADKATHGGASFLSSRAMARNPRNTQTH